MKKTDLTLDEFKKNVSNIKREVDELDRRAHGMTFEELIRLLAVRQGPDGAGDEKENSP